MAGLGYKVFTAGEVLTAANVNGYLMQGVLVFDDSTARTAAIGTPTEGMVAYLKDTNATEYYDGSAWQGISNPGDITAVTAGTALTGGGSSGDVTLNVDIAAISTAQAGTALTATGEVLDVDLAAVGSGIVINSTQIDSTMDTKATNYTIVSSDAGKYIRFTTASTATINSSTGFAVGEQVQIIADGTALAFTSSGITFAGAGTAATTFEIGNQYEAVSILCVASNNYRIIGNVSAV